VKKTIKDIIGYTRNLKRRIEEHDNGLVQSTKYRRPLRLIYYEACLNEEDALKREKYLKTQWGFKYLQRRLRNYLI